HNLLNRGQMALMALELASPSSNFCATSVGGRLTKDVRYNMHQTYKHGGSSLESGFEPRIRCYRRRYFTIITP
ncbi:hypothetical protein AVEN_161405-1, partial [Araneus ventricosus]